MGENAEETHSAVSNPVQHVLGRVVLGRTESLELGLRKEKEVSRKQERKSEKWKGREKKEDISDKCCPKKSKRVIKNENVPQ